MSAWLGTDSAANILTTLVILGAIAAFFYLWRSPVWGMGLHRLLHRRVALVCLAILSVYVVIGLLDSYRWTSKGHVESQTILDRIAARPPERSYSAPLARYGLEKRVLRPLKGRHLLGTDGLGADVLYQSLKGCRTALIVGCFTLVMSVPLAIIFGITAGYFGGIVDDVVQYVYITLSSIPSILLLVTLMMVMGRGLLQICIALGVTEWVGLARYLRGETLKHREKEYVLAARAVGVHPLKVLYRHILPNVFHLVIISATLSFSGLVLSEVILSYLGIEVPPEVGSWGTMIDAARMELARDPIVWWNLAGATIGLFGLVLPANILGDATRDAFDPRLREG